MEIKLFKSLLQTIFFMQLLVLSIIGLVFYFFNVLTYSSAFFIAGVSSALYTYLLKISSQNKYLAFLGFPIRILLVSILCAILVNKSNANLIGLFIGFVIAQGIYLYYIWANTTKQIQQ